MVATACIAAVYLSGQASKTLSLDQKIQALGTDLRQSLTLLDSLKAKVNNERDATKLLGQFAEKMTAIGATADKYLAEAKTDEAKVKILTIKFEAFANGSRPAQQVENLANDIATKFKESPALCFPIEDLTFYQYLGPQRYSTFEASLKQSKNEEVLASTGLANTFIQFFSDAGDVNKFKILSQQYPKTKAGQRAGKVFDYRTKLILGQPLLDLPIDLLGGTKINANSLKGKVVLINFWGFWSDGSVNDLSDVQFYASKYPSKLVVIGVNTDNWTPAYVGQRLKESKITWQNAAAGSPTGRLPMDLGITIYPSKFIVDAAGIVRYLPSNRDWKAILIELLDKE